MTSNQDWGIFISLIQNAMQIVGFMEEEVQSVLELVAAVLKLGNIEFKPESRVNGFDESRVKDKNGEDFTKQTFFVHFLHLVQCKLTNANYSQAEKI